MVLKAFGATATGRRAYRVLGNRLMSDRHSVLGAGARARGMWVWDEIGARLPVGERRPRVLELGTGWTHFYGLFLRLAYPVELVFFDVVDNRNLEALRSRFAHVVHWLRGLDAPDERVKDAISLAERVCRAQSFEALYRLVGATYVVNPAGSFAGVVESPFDCVMSMDVLEHVPVEDVDNCVAAIARVLARGGLSAHQIGLNDHLSSYAPGMPAKNFIRFRETTWKLLFENRLQYVNRLPPSEFRRLFADQALELQAESLECDWETLGSRLRPAGRFAQLGPDDLCATRMTVVHTRV